MNITAPEELQLEKWNYKIKDDHAFKYVGHGMFILTKLEAKFKLRFIILNTAGEPVVWSFQVIESVMDIPEAENEMFHKSYSGHSVALTNSEGT